MDRSQAHAREVFREAILQNASVVILCHNHPSGDPMPSAQDVSCSKDIANAGKIIGIELRDHVIIGRRTPETERDFIALRELGML